MNLYPDAGPFISAPNLYLAPVDTQVVLYNRRIRAAVRPALRVAARHEPFGATFLRRLAVDELWLKGPVATQPCGIARGHVVLNQQGESALCPMTLHQPVAKDADDLLAPLREHYPRYASAPIDPTCRACRWLSACGTGCPTLNEERSGNPNARSPFCDAYQGILEDWIEAYGRTLLPAHGERNG